MAVRGLLSDITGDDFTQLPPQHLAQHLPSRIDLLRWDNACALEDLRQTSDGRALLGVLDSRPTPSAYAYAGPRPR